MHTVPSTDTLRHRQTNIQMHRASVAPSVSVAAVAAATATTAVAQMVACLHMLFFLASPAALARIQLEPDQLL